MTITRPDPIRALYFPPAENQMRVTDRKVVPSACVRLANAPSAGYPPLHDLQAHSHHRTGQGRGVRVLPGTQGLPHAGRHGGGGVGQLAGGGGALLGDLEASRTAAAREQNYSRHLTGDSACLNCPASPRRRRNANCWPLALSSGGRKAATASTFVQGSVSLFRSIAGRLCIRKSCGRCCRQLARFDEQSSKIASDTIIGK